MSSKGDETFSDDAAGPFTAGSEGGPREEIVEGLVEELLRESGERSEEDSVDGLVEGFREEDSDYAVETEAGLLVEPGKDIDEALLDELVAKLVEKAPKRRYTGIEERKHIRFSVTGLADLTMEGVQTKRTYLANLSRGGAGLYMHEQLKSDQEVMLDLSLIKEDWMNAEMNFAARIRYAFKVGEMYLTGMQFDKTSSRSFAYLLTYLQHVKDLQDR